MKRRSFVVASMILGLGLVAGVSQAQNPAARVGEKIDEAVRGVKDQFARAKTAVHDMGVEARVYGRLHWDKALNGVDFTLEVRKGGVATIHATVPDSAMKAKALALAGDTVGITQVIDQIVVSPSTTTTTTTTTTKTTTPP